MPAERIVATIPLPAYSDAVLELIDQVRDQWAEKHAGRPFRVLLDLGFEKGQKILIIDARQI